MKLISGKLITGIILGAALALGGGYVYKTYFCGCGKAANTTAAAAIGQTAPDFALKNQNGDMVRLSDYAGKGPVVLEWFNKDCPYVKKFYSIGAMQDLQKAKTAKGTIWLRITSSAPNKQGYLDEAGLKAEHAAANAIHTLVDPTGDVGRLYGAQTTPHMFVIGLGGNLAYNGAIDNIKSFDSADVANAENYVTAALDALRSGTAIANPQTTPYGCSVKY